MNTIKKITFLGNFRVDFTTESHHLKTFRKLGIEVETFQESEASIQQITKSALQSDMFMWTHTHGWNTEGIAKLLKLLKEKGIPSVGYHLDLWMGIERQKNLETDPYWGLEYFFTVDKLFEGFMNSQEGLPKAFYMPAGVLEDECYIGEKKAAYDFDVVFVGSKVYHKEWPYRTQLIEWLEKTYGNRFANYGHHGKGVLRGEPLNNLYASAKVVVGDTLCKEFKYPFYYSDRIFETTGRGGFIIHPYIEGIQDEFETQQYNYSLKHEFNDPIKTFYGTDRAEIITYPFGNFDYLKYLIDYFIKNDEEREAIKLRGHERTKKAHTYTQRLQYLLETISAEKESKAQTHPL